MKIKSKLIIELCVILTLVISLSVYNYINLVEITKPITKDIPDHIFKLEKVYSHQMTELRLQLKNEKIKNILLNHLQTNNVKWKKQFDMVRQEQYHEVTEYLKSFPDHALVDSLKILYRKKSTLEDSLMRADSKEVLENYLISSNLYENFLISTALLEEFNLNTNIEDVYIGMKTAQKNVQTITENNIRNGAIITIAIIFIIIISFIINIKSILKPISQVVEKIKEIGKGNFNLKIEGKGHGEFQGMIESFNDVIKNLKINTTLRDALNLEMLRRMELESSLQLQNQKLTQSSKFKSEFLANMSHELRTPLNCIILLSSTIKDHMNSNLNKDQAEAVQTIDRCAKDLLDLINDVLDISKIEAGQMEIHITENNIQELVEFINATFKKVIEEKNLSFSIINELDESMTIQTDLMKLKQIVKNLLSNALKFTEQGSITLKLSHDYKNSNHHLANNDNLWITVEDTGIGIAEQKLKTIFLSFKQAETGISRKYGGTGLGLAISKNYAQMLGGNLFVESEVDLGTTFILYVSKHLKEVNF